jgi:hypothetical protein
VKLYNLILDREKINCEIGILTSQSERLANRTNKTNKEVAELSVEMFNKKNELFLVQYQINQLLLTATTIAANSIKEVKYE